MLLFTLVVSLGTGILFGLIPALHGSKTDLNVALKESGGWTGSGFKQNKVRSLLVVGEVALALLLLIGSALLIRTNVALAAVNAGFMNVRMLCQPSPLPTMRIPSSRSGASARPAAR